MLKKIPVGVSDFKEVIQDNYYYVDKSLLIKELIDDGSKVVLLPRPRRFGKTLNLSMLKYFFDLSERDNLFEGLGVWDYDYCRDMRGKYPVVFISFKDVKVDNFEGCMTKLKEAILNGIQEFNYLLGSAQVDTFTMSQLEVIYSTKAENINFESTLAVLSKALEQHHQQKVVILIDEYDAPIHAGYTHKYFDQIIGFMRNFLSAGFKDNVHLYKGVITGILRVAKESVFSGLNNIAVATLLEPNYSDKFGLLESEVENLIKYYGKNASLFLVKDWYNGYQFGNSTVYNPWSIISFANSGKDSPEPYWVNTSSNDIIRDLITASGSSIKQEFEKLLADKPVRKQINSEIVMRDLEKVDDAVWSFLLFSGYLKQQNLGVENRRMFADLSIPNEEVKYLYENIILNWFKESLQSDDFQLLLQSILSGDAETFEDIFSSYILSSLSYNDFGNDPEKTYHAFVLGMLVALPKGQYQIKSNRESGYGRYDVMVIPSDKSKAGIVLEFKKLNTRRNETLEKAVMAALNQIEEKQYRQELLDLGFTKVFEYGVAVGQKDVLVELRVIE